MPRANTITGECKMQCRECVYDGACEIPAQMMNEMLEENIISMNYMIDTDTREE